MNITNRSQRLHQQKIDASAIAHALLGRQPQIGSNENRSQCVGHQHQNKDGQCLITQNKNNTHQQRRNRKSIACNGNQRDNYLCGNTIEYSIELFGKICGSILNKKFVPLLKNISINLINKVIPYLRAQKALHQRHKKTHQRGEPEGTNQQGQKPAGLI